MFVPLLYSIDSSVDTLPTAILIETGQIFFVSFGISIFLATPFCAAAYFFVLIKFFEKRPHYNFRLFPLAGMASGFLWNVGTCCSVFATLYLGLSCGFALAHTSLLISGFWSILLFQEIKGARSIGLFCFSALIMGGGAVLLGVNGHR